MFDLRGATAAICLLVLAGCSTDTTDEGAGTTTRNSSRGEDDEGKDARGETAEWGEEDEGEAGKDEDGWGEELPPELEEARACMECWYKSPGPCAGLLEACESDLACSQLLECPYECGANEDCFAQCNEIIPSGVEPVTELVQCLVCQEDSPCAADCTLPGLLDYCG